MTTDLLDDQGKAQTLTAIVEDQPQMQDPDKPAQAKVPTYTMLTAAEGSLTDPRAVTKFTEEDGRWHKVIEYREERADQITWKWFCEAQRA